MIPRQVPILKKVCDALQQPAWQLERELSSGDGQKALMEFLVQRKSLRDVPKNPKTKWMEMPPAAWELVLSFNGITDLAAAMSVDRARCQHAGTILSCFGSCQSCHRKRTGFESSDIGRIGLVCTLKGTNQTAMGKMGFRLRHQPAGSM